VAHVGLLSVLGWFALLSCVIGPAWLALGAVCVVGGAAGGVVVGFTIVSERFAGANAATALALVNGAVFLGVAVLEPVFGWLFDLARDDHPGTDPLGTSRSAFVPGLTLLLAVSIVGWAAAVRLAATQRIAAGTSAQP
jgi:hypothetical protein